MFWLCFKVIYRVFLVFQGYLKGFVSSGRLLPHPVVSTVGSRILFGSFSTVEWIPTIFGYSYEDMVGVQRNTKPHPLKVNFPSRLELF